MKHYLTQADIMRLLGVGQKAAKKIFDSAYAIDEKELGEYLLYKKKVRESSVKKVTKLKW